MAEKVSLSSDGKYIRVFSEGPPSLGEMKETVSRILEIRREYRIEKVLVDSRNRDGQPSVSELYQGGEWVAEKLGPGTRIAILTKEMTEDHSLFENIAVNRGASISFFRDEHLALVRLLKG